MQVNIELSLFFGGGGTFAPSFNPGAPPLPPPPIEAYDGGQREGLGCGWRPLPAEQGIIPFVFRPQHRGL